MDRVKLAFEMKTLLVALGFAGLVCSQPVRFGATASGTMVIGTTTVPFTNQLIAIQQNYNARPQFTGAVGSQSTGVVDGSVFTVLGRLFAAPSQVFASENTITFSQQGYSSISITDSSIGSLDLNTGNGSACLTSAPTSGTLTFVTNGGILSIFPGAVFRFGGCNPGPVGSGGTTFTTTTVHQVAVTQKTAEVDTFLTRLTASLSGGSPVYDHSFNAAFSDPAVQTAVTAARAALTSAAGSTPVTVSGPTQTSNSKTLTGTSTQTVDGTPVLTQTTANTIGPAFILFGEDQMTTSAPQFVNPVSAGNINVDVLSSFVTPRTVTTTSTYQVAQTYALAGTTQLPATPVPPSLLLTLTGLAGVGLHEIRRRREQPGSDNNGSSV